MITSDFKEEKISFYKSQIGLYGWLTLCYLIDRYSRREDYEECTLILSALREFYSEHAIDFPTEWNSESIGHYRQQIRNITGSDGTAAVLNIPDYCDEIIAKTHKPLSDFDKTLKGMLSVPKPKS